MFPRRHGLGELIADLIRGDIDGGTIVSIVFLVAASAVMIWWKWWR